MSDDPTDNALAAIASILDQTTTPPAKVTEKPADKAADKTTPESPPVEALPVAVAMPPPLPESIEPAAAPSEPAAAESAPPPVVPEPLPAPEPQTEPQPIRPIEANGYSKVGPGPMAALRFRWTVREDGGRYYVDETFGEGSSPHVNGPMDGDAAIRFVDEREAAARQRFEHFKQEMISRTAVIDPARNDSGEA
ncbi:hypothetical protein JQ633_20275 [Bradyrhizobium tropiciagri]|uniref:hypothetical protein n=1 Tax=Bradyrhizobium tropiciagri TaxID=312253 RepID=UPI001BACE33B|nr:hypothetical protein [Bradyrhizobium tropiciagri]MBR0872710.1 hypothetical protein [Bradyrhizobium tropiciagri]